MEFVKKKMKKINLFGHGHAGSPGTKYVHGRAESCRQKINPDLNGGPVLGYHRRWLPVFLQKTSL